jgi:PAS domain S-box-containing protein
MPLWKPHSPSRIACTTLYPGRRCAGPATRRFLLVLLLQLGLASITAAAEKPLQLDPALPMSQYVVDAWRDSDGLPVDTVAAIAQTPDGYLWLATEHGLARFDGIRFVVFNTKTTPSLRSEDIFALTVSHDGTLWIGTRGGGVTTLQGNRFAHVPLQARFPLAFAEAGDGTMWIAGPKKIFTVRNGVTRDSGVEITTSAGHLPAMAADERDGIFVSTTSGLLHVDPRGSKAYSGRDGPGGAPIGALLRTANGLLLGTEDGGVSRLSGDRFQPLVPPSLAHHAIRSIAEGADGSLFMATDGGGLMRFWKGKVDRLTASDGPVGLQDLTSNSIRQVLEDQEGNLWVATTGGGLIRLKQGKLVTVTIHQPLGAEFILAMTQAHDGSVWAGTYGGGLNHISGSSVTRYTKADGLLSNTIFALAEDPEGTLWVGTEGGLQGIAHGRVTRTITNRDGLPADAVGGITVSRDGALWVATQAAGLAHVKDGKVIVTNDLGPQARLVSIREAADGSLWVATATAVEHVTGKRVEIVAGGQGLRTARITSMHVDEVDGSLWIATTGDGLERIHDGKVRVYRTTDGLLDDSVYAIVQDRAGDLWIPTSRGLFEIERTSLAAFDAGDLPRIPTTVFRKSDGLKSSDFSGGVDVPGFKAVDGNLWFATTRGIVVVNPDRLLRNPNPPHVVIEDVVSGGAIYDSSDGRLDLEAGKRQIEIEYTALTFYAPDTLRFEYKLEGFDDAWRDAGVRRTAYYTNVPPGNYRFRVRATTSDETTGEASTSIRIEPRFYETWPFRTALALMVLLMALVYDRRRMASIRAHEAELLRSEEHFRSLIENGADMILVVDGEGTLQYVSPSVHRTLGFDPSDLIGKPVADFLMGEDDFGELERFKGRRFRPHSGAMHFRDADGASRELEAVGARSGDGSLVLNCRDMTDRRKLEAQLEQANRLSSLGRLAATVSHEFNNVLMGIQPFVDVMRRKSSDPAIAHATAQIGRSIKRGKLISEEILRYTRPVPPALRPVVVREWLLDLEIEIRSLIGSDVRLVIVAPLEGMTIAADISQLTQVLTNLAINSRDAGATSVRIESQPVEGSGVFPFGIVMDPERFAHISFTDNGGGVPEAILKKIFEPLFTTKTTRGTGLGLAVAQHVVAGHGGEIFVESRMGVGTTFHLFIPLAVSTAGEELRGEDVVATTIAPGRRVLVVEDDSTVAEGILALLELEGFSTALAINGGDALSIIPRFDPDVVVLDVGLPDIGGVELFEMIAMRWPGLGVIFSSGQSDIAAIEGIVTAGRAVALGKPYTVEELMAAISTTLDRAHAVA